LSIPAAVARRYAVALADVITAHGEAREVQEELSAWEEMAHASTLLQEVFRNPTIPYEQKHRVVKTLIDRTRVRPTTSNYLLVLLQNQRLADLGEINTALDQELDRRSGIVSAQVTTARAVPQQTQEALRARLAEMTGSKMRLQFDVDDELIGGVVTRIGSTIYDGSVRSQLQQIKQKIVGEQ
jgi:F-type H+-transporting ATPase subunit delta